MKIISALLLSLVVQPSFGRTAITDLAQARGSYLTAQEFLDNQMSQVQDLLYKLSEAQARRDNAKVYSRNSTEAEIEIGELEARIRSKASEFDGQSVRIRTNNLQEQVLSRQTNYLKMLRNATAMDKTQLQEASPQLRQDIEFMRTAKELSPEDFNRRLNLYQARNFGIKLTDANIKRT